MTPLISVVIPVKNGDNCLKDLFEGLAKQTLYKDCEIIVIDSGSTDNSLKICDQYDVVVHQIAPASFNHGLTRKFGVELSKGKYVLMTVQDALPQNETFLEQMVACFQEEEVAAVCGLQIVPVLPQTNPFEWFRPVSVPEIYYYQFPDAGAFDRLSPDEKRRICSWDDVCAMYRRDILEILPFEKVIFGEDMTWCKTALRAGYKICYNPQARVFHFHLNEGDYLYKRTLTEFFSFYELFGCVPERGNFLRLGRRIISLLIKEKRVSFRRKLFWIGEEIRCWMIIQKVVRDFLKYMKRGDAELKNYHQKICGQPAQAPKQ